MATTKAKSKSSSTKKTTSKTTVKKAAPAKAKTTVKTVTTTPIVSSAPSKKAASKLPANLTNIVLAELVGTFILALVATMTVVDVTPLYVGLTLAALVMTIGAVSGAHVNPAVTFGLWSMKKVKSIMLPFYWGAQLIGAMAAVVVASLISGSQLGLNFGHFLSFDWSVFAVEFIGATVFLFILTSVVARSDVSASGKSIGIGFALFIGLVVAGSLIAPVAKTAEAQYLKDLQAKAAESETGSPDMEALRTVPVPSSILVGGATLNPAVALATTEAKSAEEVWAGYGINDTSSTATDTSSTYTRFTGEVILATMLGALAGAGLTRILSYTFKNGKN